MRIFIICDDGIRMEDLRSKLGSVIQDAVIEAAAPPAEDEEAWSVPPDMVFIDTAVQNRGIIQLAKDVRLRSDNTGIVFIAEDDSYALDGFKMHAQGYLIRPVTEDMLRDECRFYERTHSAGAMPDADDRHELEITAFGNFEIRIDGKPVRVKRTRTKELLAYLVDRNGSMVSDAELLSILWSKSDSTAKSYLRMLKAEMISIFEAAGYGDAIVKQRGSIGIRNDLVSCDYFDAMKTAPPDLSRYHGEYMKQYAWGRQTRIMLNRIVRTVS